ncbi:MAG: hypothetical protein S4CHLAM102_08510 [Chlamydiia bacterium]|nr:hypothetical protein [Chlamydiia bacterium]
MVNEMPQIVMLLSLIAPLLSYGNIALGKSGKPKAKQNNEKKSSAKITLNSEDQKFLQLTSPDTLKKINEGRPIDLYDVIAMHEAGMSGDVIIQIMQKTDSHFKLRTNQVIRLQSEGIPFKVINFMIRT